MDIPILATKQVNFGPTATQITSHYHKDVKIVTKRTFSMINNDTLPYLEGLKRKHAVLYGWETHICIKQTCLDLLDRGYDVHIVVDACDTMKSAADRNVGMQAMRDAGAHLTTF